MQNPARIACACVLGLALCACGSKKEAGYKMLDEKVSTEQYAIGFRKADVALTDAVNAQLLAMAQDGKLGEISTAWFGSDVTIVAEQAAK